MSPGSISVGNMVAGDSFFAALRMPVNDYESAEY